MSRIGCPDPAEEGFDRVIDGNEIDGNGEACLPNGCWPYRHLSVPC